MRKQLFYAETGLGACVRIGLDYDEVYESLLREVGTHNGVDLVRPATDEDIDNVRMMGGYIPEAR
jgi:hypothetical protein